MLHEQKKPINTNLLVTRRLELKENQKSLLFFFESATKIFENVGYLSMDCVDIHIIYSY
jgi:hypothetical protein